eukprot:3986745-Amphidinium_carterae.1
MDVRSFMLVLHSPTSNYYSNNAKKKIAPQRYAEPLTKACCVSQGVLQDPLSHAHGEYAHRPSQWKSQIFWAALWGVQ